MMKTVLVVDDEPDIVEIMRLTLEHAGYRVATAANGAQALEVVTREKPDVMLLDVGMPEVDGWQVLDRLKSGGTDLSDVPVVMVTAWASEADRLRGGIEGAVHYVAKPFDPEKIVEVVGDLLRPGAPTEPDLRRKVQTDSLEQLARIESGRQAAPTDEDGGPRVHLTRLDRPKEEESSATEVDLDEFLDSLPGRQQEVARRVAAGESVAGIADALGVSRSNIYSVLRRVARRAGLADGRSVIRRLRSLGPAAER